MAQTDTHMPQNGADLLQTSTSAGQTVARVLQTQPRASKPESTNNKASPTN